MNRAEMIEAVARKLRGYDNSHDGRLMESYRNDADSILDLVRPLVLEEAAAVCEEVSCGESCEDVAYLCATRIRALAKIAT